MICEFFRKRIKCVVSQDPRAAVASSHGAWLKTFIKSSICMKPFQQLYSQCSLSYGRARCKSCLQPFSVAGMETVPLCDRSFSESQRRERRSTTAALRLQSTRNNGRMSHASYCFLRDNPHGVRKLPHKAKIFQALTANPANYCWMLHSATTSSRLHFQNVFVLFNQLRT